MKRDEFTTIFKILMRNHGDQVGCCIASDFEMDAAVVAGSMISILEAVLSQLDDCEQIETEQEIITLFTKMLDERHAFVTKESLEDEEDEDDS